MDSNFVSIAITIIFSYLLGSIPSAYLAGRLKKRIDIRRVGTRNMGAMNVFYQVGFVPGLLVLLVDLSKGAAAIALARWLGVPLIVELLAGAGAIIGHSFPVWLRFSGGKGGATFLGILAFLLPWAIPIYLAIFGVMLLFTRFPTFSYSIGFICFPFVAWLIYHDGVLVVYSIALMLLLGLRYIPRLKEIRSKSGNWRHAFLRKDLKDRM